MNREEFCNHEGSEEKHNALFDAVIIRKCHAKLKDEKLQRIYNRKY